MAPVKGMMATLRLPALMMHMRWTSTHRPHLHAPIVMRMICFTCVVNGVVVDKTIAYELCSVVTANLGPTRRLMSNILCTRPSSQRGMSAGTFGLAFGQLQQLTGPAAWTRVTLRRGTVPISVTFDTADEMLRALHFAHCRLRRVEDGGAASAHIEL